jgi:hypothetical protein
MLSSAVLMGQDFDACLAKSLRVFYGQHYDVTMKVKVFGNALEVVPEYEVTSRYRKSPLGVIVNTPISDQLMTRKYVIAVMHEEEVIFVREADKGWSPAMVLPVDSLVKFAKEHYAWGMNKVTRASGEITFLFNDPENDFHFLKYVFSEKTGLLMRVTFQPRIDEELFGQAVENPPVFEYIFAYNDKAPDDTEFREEKYLLKKQRTLQLVPKYKNYKLINHIQ